MPSPAIIKLAAGGCPHPSPAPPRWCCGRRRRPGDLYPAGSAPEDAGKVTRRTPSASSTLSSDVVRLAVNRLRQDLDEGLALVEVLSAQAYEEAATHPGRRNRGLPPRNTRNNSVPRVARRLVRRHPALPEGLDQPGTSNGSVSGNQRDLEGKCRGNDEPVPRITDQASVDADVGV